MVVGEAAQEARMGQTTNLFSIDLNACVTSA